MSASSFMRLRNEIAIAALIALAGAVLLLAGFLMLGWLSARLSFACPRLLPGQLTPPHAAPWQVGGCSAVHRARLTNALTIGSAKGLLGPVLIDLRVPPMSC